jgi:hypothetical protein
MLRLAGKGFSRCGGVFTFNRLLRHFINFLLLLRFAELMLQ